MIKLLWTIWALLVTALPLLIASLIFRIVFNETAVSNSDVNMAVGSVGVAIALFTFIFSQIRKSSEEYLESAIELLSNAHEILDKDKDEMDRPKAKRMNWLASARLVQAAQNIANQITEEGHRRI